uniref:PorV/PorQ family protein n=1 Tax=candidate division WOR-3 bacterium TaxID=2052148 RepID=A0A7C4Y6E4_UNCW3
MIFLFFSILEGDFQNLIQDARNFGICGVSSSIPGSPFDNPSFSSINISSIGIDGGYIFGGLATVLTLKGSINKGVSGYGFLFFNHMIPGIPDTRNALVDLNGNGEFDEGEYLDTSKIVMSNAFQNLFLFNISKKSGSLSYGINLKIFYENIMGERGIGGGIDLGGIYKNKDISFGLVLKDITSSMIIWEKTKDRISPSIVLGGSYRIEKNDFGFLPCFDFIIDETGFFSLFGIEISYKDMVMFSSGMKKGGFSFGSGFLVKDYRLNYSLAIDIENDFPITHRFTISKCFYKE